MRIVILNGPNLNLLGRREPAIYGTRSMEQVLLDIQRAYPELHIAYHQSNHEGDLRSCARAIGDWQRARGGWYRTQCRWIYPYQHRPARCRSMQPRTRSRSACVRHHATRTVSTDQSAHGCLRTQRDRAGDRWLSTSSRMDFEPNNPTYR